MVSLIYFYSKEYWFRVEIYKLQTFTRNNYFYWLSINIFLQSQFLLDKINRLNFKNTEFFNEEVIQ